MEKNALDITDKSELRKALEESKSEIIPFHFFYFLIIN